MSAQGCGGLPARCGAAVLRSASTGERDDAAAVPGRAPSAQLAASPACPGHAVKHPPLAGRRGRLAGRLWVAAGS